MVPLKFVSRFRLVAAAGVNAGSIQRPSRESWLWGSVTLTAPFAGTAASYTARTGQTTTIIRRVIECFIHGYSRRPRQFFNRNCLTPSRRLMFGTGVRRSGFDVRCFGTPVHYQLSTSVSSPYDKGCLNCQQFAAVDKPADRAQQAGFSAH